MPKPKPPVLEPQGRTNPIIWCFATICAIIATIIIITGIIVFVGYLVIRPKIPVLYVQAARLDEALYNQEGVLAVRLTITIKVENHNRKDHVHFYNTKFILGYQRLSIAQLVADPFDVPKNSSQELYYVVESSPIPLNQVEQEITQETLRKTKAMMFFLKGNSRTRWRVGSFGLFKFWLHINCHMWLPVNRTVEYPHCSTSSH